MQVGVFIPIGNNGWLISTTSPQYKDEVLNLSRWIDSYLERRWKELDVKPAPLAEDVIYFRRLTRLDNLSGAGAGACLGKSWIN